jgi:WD40 repeat protein
LIAQPARVDALGDPLPERAIARLGTKRLMQYHSVQCVAFSPDGKSLATAGYGDGIWLWEWPAGKLERRLLPMNENTDFMRYTPNGKHIISLWGYRKHGLSVWDAMTGKHLASADLPRPKGFNPGLRAVGNEVVTAPESERVVRVFSIATKRWLDPITRDSPILAVGVDPEDRILVAEFVGDHVRISSAGAGKIDRRIRVTKKPVAAGFGPNAVWAGVVDEDGTFTTVKLDDGMPAFPSQKLPVKAFPVAFSADGKRAILGVASIGTAVWDLTTGKALHPLPEYVQNLHGAAAFTPDGMHVAAAYPNAPQAATFLDASTGKLVDLFSGHRVEVADFVFLSTGNELATSARWIMGDGVVRVWDIDSGKVVRRVNAHFSVWRMWPIDGGKKLLTQGYTGPDQYRLWDTRSLTGGRVILNGSEQSLEAAVWPDGSKIAYTSTAGNRSEIRLRDVKTGAEKILAVPRESGALADLAGNADTLVLTSVGNIRLIPVDNPATGQTVTTTRFQRVRVSPDGRFLAICELPSPGKAPPVKTPPRLRVIEVRGASEVFSVDLPGASYDAAFSPVAPLVASDDGSGNVRVFDYTTGKQLLSFRAADGYIRRLLFSPDGTRLATAGGRLDASCAYVWDVAELKRSEPQKATAEQLDNWVKALMDPNSGVATRAAWELIDRPSQGLAALQKALDAVKLPDMKRVGVLIAQLADEDFKTREAATRELVRMGQAVRDQVTQALARSESAEQRVRLTEILDDLKNQKASPDMLFGSRSAFVLERIGNKAAIGMLKEAAKKGSYLGREAAAALERLNRGANE